MAVQVAEKNKVANEIGASGPLAAMLTFGELSKVLNAIWRGSRREGKVKLDWQSQGPIDGEVEEEYQAVWQKGSKSLTINVQRHLEEWTKKVGLFGHLTISLIEEKSPEPLLNLNTQEVTQQIKEQMWLVYEGIRESLDLPVEVSERQRKTFMDMVF